TSPCCRGSCSSWRWPYFSPISSPTSCTPCSTRAFATGSGRRTMRDATRSRRLAALVARAIETRGAGLGLVGVAGALLLAIGAEWVAPYNPDRPQQAGVLAAPSRAHWLGTDQLGRDVLSRIIFGTRTSMRAGVVSVGFALIVGVLIGLVAGYHSGWID